jgi:hypothetical protein
MAGMQMGKRYRGEKSIDWQGGYEATHFTKQTKQMENSKNQKTRTSVNSGCLIPGESNVTKWLKHLQGIEIPRIR